MFLLCVCVSMFCTILCKNYKNIQIGTKTFLCDPLKYATPHLSKLKSLEWSQVSLTFHLSNISQAPLTPHFGIIGLYPSNTTVTRRPFSAMILYYLQASTPWSSKRLLLILILLILYKGEHSTINPTLITIF
jgi:hypothetical protein